MTSGDIHAVHIGRYWRVPRVNLERYVDDLVTAPSPRVEKVPAVNGWELRLMGDQRTYTRANGTKFTRTVSWHLGDGKSTLCGRSEGNWEVTDRKWDYSRICQKCEEMKARLSGLKPEAVGLPEGTGRRRKRPSVAGS